MPACVAAIALLEALSMQPLHSARLTVLAYCTEPECETCRAWNWQTADGSDPFRRGVAVTRDCGIPLGARVCVPGYGWARADDRSGADEPCIEVRFQSHEAAVKWGRQMLEIFWRKP